MSYVKHLLWSVLALMGMSACAQNELPSNRVNLQGIVYVKGSAPHTYVVIEEQQSHKNYKVRNPERFHLMEQQKKSLNVEAIIVKEAIGPGFPAEIEIISID